VAGIGGDGRPGPVRARPEAGKQSPRRSPPRGQPGQHRRPRDLRAAFVDRGTAWLGPAWLEPLLLALQVNTAAVVGEVRGHPDPAAAVDFLVSFGGSQAWNAGQPARPGLSTSPPSAPAGQHQDDAARILDAAAALKTYPALLVA